MPIEVGIWRVTNGVQRINYSAIESEKKLEDILEEDISILSEDLLLVGRQISTGYGKYIDMLAIDQEGTLWIIELKKSRTPRDVVAQVIDYASWIQTLTYEEVKNIYQEKNKTALEEGYSQKFGNELPEELSQAHQMLIVSAELDSETERIINYLSNNYNVPINAVFFRYFKQDDQEFITRSWLIDPTVVEEKAISSNKAVKQEQWNNQDFVVNFFDDNDYRDWEDAIKYGFISAGNGKWYSQTLKQLFIGARVFCMIPKSGYVGIGRVTATAVPLKKAEVKQEDGTMKKLTECDLNATNMLHDLDDMEKCEYVVGIEWIITKSKESAFWISGLRANQNSAYKLRSQYTIDKVSEHFALDQQ